MHFLKQQINLAEYEVEFKVGRFVRFLLYNLSWFTMGPLMLVFFLPIEGYAMANNMGFCSFKYYFFTQFLQFVLLMTTIALKYGTDTPNIYPEEGYFAVLSIVIRSFIISCRYGYISTERLDALRSSAHPAKYVEDDLILINIVNIVPNCLNAEIPASFWRNEIEEEEFCVRFLEKPSPDLEKRLRNGNFYSNDDKYANLMMLCLGTKEESTRLSYNLQWLRYRRRLILESGSTFLRRASERTSSSYMTKTLFEKSIRVHSSCVRLRFSPT